MRILHISNYYYPHIGGVESVCKHIVDNTVGHEVQVICFNEGYRSVVEKVDGINVYRVGTWFSIARQSLSLSYFFILKCVLKRFKPDVIQFHWANPFPAAILLLVMPKDVKLIVHWHMDIVRQRIIYKVIKSVETMLLKRADFVIVTSPQYRDGSTPLQPYKDKVKVVQNGINDSKLQPPFRYTIDAIKDKYDGKQIVFFVGRHTLYKGLGYLLDAEKFTKSDCVFVIAGDGPLKKKLMKHNKSKRVYFVGRLSDEILNRYYYASSVFAFPSITKNEAFGMALAEAMYCFTPAVTFTITGSGVNWVNLNGVTGIEVPNSDAKAFARAIDKLLTDESLANDYAEAAHQRVAEHFTLGKMMEEMEKCYQELNNHAG